MKRFVEFTRDWQMLSYENRIRSIVSKKQKCVVHFSCWEDSIVSIVRYFMQIGIDIECISVLEKKPDLPESLEGKPVVDFDEVLSLSPDTERIFFHKGNDLRALKLCDCVQQHGMHPLAIYDIEAAKREFRFLFSHLDKIYEVYESLSPADDSRETYLSALNGMAAKDLNSFQYADSVQYFLEGYLPVRGGVVIDGGAYDGKSSADFALSGCNVHAFELDQNNYEKAKKNAEAYGFVLENYGLGDHEEFVHYQSDQTASSIRANGDLTAKIIDLDTYVLRKRIHHVDFIKLDVEGSEKASLKGAVSIISKDKPKMGICMYHLLDDMWRIPLYIKSIRPDYEFSFRHHKTDGRFDVAWNEQDKAWLEKYQLDYFIRTQWETVLYCR